jgi:hypothetical protein
MNAAGRTIVGGGGAVSQLARNANEQPTATNFRLRRNCI